VSKQIDIFAAIDQALGQAVESRAKPAPKKPDPPWPGLTGAEWEAKRAGLPIRKPIPGSPQDEAPLPPIPRAPSEAKEKEDAGDFIDGVWRPRQWWMGAHTRHFIPAPDGDTAAMSPGELWAWCRNAAERCELVAHASSDPQWIAPCRAARQFYWMCQHALSLSLERTHASLFAAPWERITKVLPAPECRAIEFVQGKIALAHAQTQTDRNWAAAAILASGNRLAALGLIPPDLPVAVRDGRA
jgi:hypothetical protein